MGEVTLHASATETSSGNGSATPPADSEFVGLFIHVTAVSGVLPTLAVKLQESPNGGVDWYDVPNGGGIANLIGISTTGTSSLFASEIGRKLLDDVRCVWTITGVGPSYTFEVLLGTV